MANTIKVISKDQRKDPTTEHMIWTLALGLFDENGKPVNASFKQTESMTEAFVGITDYGAVFISGTNSVSDATIDVTCVDSDGEEVTSSLTVSALRSKSAGNAI